MRKRRGTPIIHKFFFSAWDLQEQDTTFSEKTRSFQEETSLPGLNSNHLSHVLDISYTSNSLLFSSSQTQFTFLQVTNSDLF